MYRSCFKPLGDFVVAAVLVVVLFPVGMVVMLALVFEKKGNVFFVQERIGYQEKPFYIIKFRTMASKKNEQGDVLPDAARITKIGFFLRKYSLDELPQLLNVLKGEMSLIGPRPLLPEYLPLYNATQRQRHQVRPGITGLAQVKGRNNITWTDRFFWDIQYVQQGSFGLDLKILFLTLFRLFTDSSLHGSVLSEKFTGKP